MLYYPGTDRHTQPSYCTSGAVAARAVDRDAIQTDSNGCTKRGASYNLHSGVAKAQLPPATTRLDFIRYEATLTVLTARTLFIQTDFPRKLNVKCERYERNAHKY